MRIDGQCHCGHVRYEAEIDPERVAICHCTDCQALTGTAYRVTVAARRDDIRLTGAPTKVYEKLADNGRKRLQHFCPECGSPLFTAGEGEHGAIWGIRWGSIRQRAELEPKRRIWARSALPWMSHIGDLPAQERD
jgi:hypothetical protein